MAGTRLFYKLQFCDSTDCTTNHFPMAYIIENNIIKHFDEMLYKNRLIPYSTHYYAPVHNIITHIQYMDSLGIIQIAEVGNLKDEAILRDNLPLVNFRGLARNFDIFGFEIYGLNEPHVYNNIEEIELYHQHLKAI